MFRCLTSLVTVPGQMTNIAVCGAQMKIMNVVDFPREMLKSFLIFNKPEASMAAGCIVIRMTPRREFIFAFLLV